MKRVIVTDSSCDRNEALDKEIAARRVPFALSCNGHHYVDDGSMDIDAFLADVDASDTVAQSAAMSPQHFIDAAGDADEIFFLTISSRLSSSYNSAALAARELCEEGKRAHAFDSKAAAAGESAYLLRLHELIQKGLSFDEIVAKEEEIAQTNYTYFVLNNYTTLSKSGRLPRLAGNILTHLSIRPICRGVNGEIGLKSIARGMDRAMMRMAEHIAAEDVPFAKRTLVITHIRDIERAEQVKREILARAPFGRVEIVEGGGLNACYANRGGIVVGF